MQHAWGSDNWIWNLNHETEKRIRRRCGDDIELRPEEIECEEDVAWIQLVHYMAQW
jgi:hypothetical protein